MYISIYMLRKLWANLVKKYHQQNQSVTVNPSAIVYNSRTDPVELLMFNFNLTNITVNTEHLTVPYEICLQACLKQRQLKSLIISTQYDATDSLKDIDVIPLTSLTYVHLITSNTKDHELDHLFPILRAAKNLDTIIYENGYLSERSMYLLTRQKKIKIVSIAKRRA